MKRISEYFGSGQLWSGTTRSSRSATARTASIAGRTVSLHVLGVREHVLVRVLEVGLLEGEDPLDEVVDQGGRLLSRRSTPRPPSASSSRSRYSSAAGRIIVRAIDAAVSASMLIFVAYCSAETSKRDSSSRSDSTPYLSNT